MKLRNIAACTAAVVLAGMLSSCRIWILQDCREGAKEGAILLDYLMPETKTKGFSSHGNVREIVLLLNPESPVPEGATDIVYEKKDGKKLTLTVGEWEAECNNQLNRFLKKVNETYKDTFALKVVDRSKLEEVMKEHQFQLSDWSDENKTAQVGKILNAHYILTCKSGPVTSNEYGINIYDIYLDFLDINTMEKIQYSYGYYSGYFIGEEFVEKILASSSLGVPLPDLEFAATKKSTVNFNRDRLKQEYLVDFTDCVCPFARTVKAASDKAMQDIASISFLPDGGCTIRMKQGEEENGRVKFRSKSKREVSYVTINRKEKAKLPDNVEIWSIGPSYWERGYYRIDLTDNRIGEIAIKSRSFTMQGFVYRNGEDIAIDYKTDESGRHWFAFFKAVKADEDSWEDDLDDDWD